MPIIQIQRPRYAISNLSPIPNSAVPLNSSSAFLTSCSFGLSSGASKFFSGSLRVSNPNNPHFYLLRGKPKPVPRSSPSAIRAAVGTDYYSTLKIDRNATLQEIKGAYRMLARKYHPDMNKSPGAEEKFKEISAAYEMMKKDLYMIALVRQVYKENMVDQTAVQQGWILSRFLIPFSEDQMGFLEAWVNQEASISI